MKDATISLRDGLQGARRFGAQPRSEVAASHGGVADHFDLSDFDLRDMIECGKALRAVSEPAGSMETAAQAMASLFYERMVNRATGKRNCVLVRCFKTHRYGQLPEDLRAQVRGVVSSPEVLEGKMPVLTLLGTAGDLPEWNDRRGSRGHAVIPLESVGFVERAPMIASLLRQMGLGIESAMYPDEALILDAEQHAFNVFHVEEALGDPAIPAQEKFVRARGIRSVLGFGGLLPSGDLFAVILFSRTHIPRATADLFRTIALRVKLALLPHTRKVIFAGTEPEVPLGDGVAVPHGEERSVGPFGDTEAEEIRSETSTLRLLIEALEAAALHQTDRLQTAFEELQKQEGRVRQQGVRLRAMLEGMTDAVFLLDREWRFTFLNGHAEELIANGRDLLGQNIWELFPEAVGKAFWENYHRAMHEGASVEFQEYYPAPLDKWFEVHAFPSDGGIAAFFRDITGRLKADAALRQTEKLAATGRLAASIAHEINNPLEAVTNLLYLLETDEHLGEEARGYVRDAESELRRVSEITTHMLRFYRQSTNPASVDLREVLDSVLVLFQGRLTRAGVTVEKRYAEAGTLEGFAGELRQIFANLVGNALDAMRDGGRLGLRVREQGEGVRVTVADSGSGMSAAVQRKVFEPFFTTKGITGTGLGLWVSLELIEKHRGTVRVRSAEGKGTVFSLYFPGVGAQAE